MLEHLNSDLDTYASDAEYREQLPEDTRICVVSLREQAANTAPMPDWLVSRLHRSNAAGGPGELTAEFEFDTDDLLHVLLLANTFLEGLTAEKRREYARFCDFNEHDLPQLSDLLMLTANIVNSASGSHNKGLNTVAPLDNLRRLLDYKTTPETICRRYSRASHVVFRSLAALYNPTILATHTIVQTEAVVSSDMPIAYPSEPPEIYGLRLWQAHTFSTLVSYDEEHGVMATSFDMYHARKRTLSNDSAGLASLDFSATRSTDSFAQVWFDLHGKRDARPMTDSAGMAERVLVAEDGMAVISGMDGRLGHALLVAQAARYVRDAEEDWSIRRLHEHEGLLDPGIILQQQEDRYLLFTVYIRNVISDALHQHLKLNSLQLVSLARLLDYVAACDIPLPAEMWGQATAIVRYLSVQPAYPATMFDSEIPVSKDARQIAIEGRMWQPEYSSPRAYAAWEEFRVEYCMMLARAGISEWIGRLPNRQSFADYPKFRFSASPQLKLKPRLPRQERYMHFLHILSLRLAADGHTEWADQISDLEDGLATWHGHLVAVD